MSFDFRNKAWVADMPKWSMHRTWADTWTCKFKVKLAKAPFDAKGQSSASLRGR